MKQPTRVALVVPPLYSSAYPQMGPPVLKAYLGRRGRHIDQLDLNTSFLAHMGEKLSLEVISNADGQQRPAEIEDLLLMYFTDRLVRRQRASMSSSQPFVGTGDDGSVEQYNPEVGAGLGYPDIVNSSHRAIARFIEDRQANYYHQYLDETLEHSRLARRYDLVGVSLTGPSQLVAALTICARIRSVRPEVEIVLGGPWATMFARELAESTDLRGYYDFVVDGEGERPLLQLIESFERGHKLPIPGVWTCDGPDPEAPEKGPPVEVCDFGPADFRGLDLDNYRAPRPVLIQASRGCYWGKCAFCVHSAGVHAFDGRVRTRTVDEILDEVEHLLGDYSPRFLCFADVSLSPKIVRGVSEAFLERGYRIPWYAFMRFEKGFDRKLLELARRAGCMLLHFGLESGSKIVLERVEKGQDLDVARRILSDATDLGFRVTVHTMAGLPGETADDLNLTLDMVEEFSDRIHESFTEIFRLERGTRIHRDPGRYGISIGSAERVFDSAISFDNDDGLSSDEARRIVNERIYGFYEDRDDLIYRFKSLFALKHRNDFPVPSVFRGSFEARLGEQLHVETVEISTTGGGILTVV